MAKTKGIKGSQWSTLESGPLARCESSERGRKQGVQEEPVDHFKEWTTSSRRKVGKRLKPRRSRSVSGPLAREDQGK